VAEGYVQVPAGTQRLPAARWRAFLPPRLPGVDC